MMLQSRAKNANSISKSFDILVRDILTSSSISSLIDVPSISSGKLILKVTSSASLRILVFSTTMSDPGGAGRLLKRNDVAYLRGRELSRMSSVQQARYASLIRSSGSSRMLWLNYPFPLLPFVILSSIRNTRDKRKSLFIFCIPVNLKAGKLLP